MALPAAKARKHELRLRARSDARTGDAQALHALLLELRELRNCSVIACYAALADEVSIDAVIRALATRDVAAVFPRVDGGDLIFHRVALDQLEPGAHGLREPRAGSSDVGASTIDAFLVPGLLFGRAGERLGRGGGHYDRALAGARPDAPRIGLCYAHRLVSELPVEEWDVSMDVIVTDREVHRP
jgi:5-formyltetrahydrofolate cyclo-ligase